MLGAGNGPHVGSVGGLQLWKERSHKPLNTRNWGINNLKIIELVPVAFLSANGFMLLECIFQGDLNH